MDAEVVRWAVGQGGIALAFAVLFHFYRKDVRQYTELWQVQTEQLLTVVKDNTTSTTRLAVIVDALHRRLDDNHPMKKD
jgi:hypothetical protein